MWVERRPLTIAARFFEKQVWVFRDRVQLEDGVNSIKYLLCTYSAPSSVLYAGITRRVSPVVKGSQSHSSDGRGKSYAGCRSAVLAPFI